MKPRLLLISGLVMAGIMTAQARFKLTNAHVEVGVLFDSVDWEWVADDETNEVEYEPEDVFLLVEPGSKTIVPNNPAYSFLGVPGSDVWIVPQIVDPNLLTVGLSAEEIPTGLFLNDAFDLRVVDVRGPGQFALYQVNAFGLPQVFANTRDGLNADDHVPMFAGFHGHFAWAFTAAGIYKVTFEVSGTLVDGTPVTSGPKTYTFFVSHRSRPFKAEL
jgi:surface-anchored protein